MINNYETGPEVWSNNKITIEKLFWNFVFD